MTIEDGGPAFPEPIGQEWRGEKFQFQTGMTLRDYFAGQALAGLMSDKGRTSALKDVLVAERPEAKAGELNELIDRAVAVSAYMIADEMLTARKVTT